MGALLTAANSSLVTVAFEADPGLLQTSGCSMPQLKAHFPTQGGWTLSGHEGQNSNMVAERRVGQGHGTIAAWIANAAGRS